MTLKVAVVAYSAPPLSSGGVASAHFNLFRLFQKVGIDARLFTFGDTQRRDGEITRRGAPNWIVSVILKLNGLMFSLLDSGKQAYQFSDICKSALGAISIDREISKFGPDVIVLSDHGAPGFFLRPRKAKTILISHHNPARFVEADPNLSALDAKIAIWFEQRALEKIDVVVCPSRYMKEWFTRTYFFDGTVEVIPNLLDEDLIKNIARIDLRAFMNLPADADIVYLPSAASKLKGADFLPSVIRGLCRCSQTEIGFYIPGFVNQHGLASLSHLPSNARLLLPGQVPYEENIGGVKDCSFGVSPSIMENYSMALLEAAYCSVPMVAFSTGGNSDIIADGKNGFLVEEGDVDLMVQRSCELLDAKKLKAMKAAGVQELDRLSSSKALNQFINLFTE